MSSSIETLHLGGNLFLFHFSLQRTVPIVRPSLTRWSTRSLRTIRSPARLMPDGVSRRRVYAALSIAMSVFAAPILSQGPDDVIRGHVSDTQHHPIAGAVVTVTSASSQMERSVRTDTLGWFSVLFLAGEHDYTVIARKVGYSPGIRRVSRSGLGSNVISADLTLAPTAFPLAPLIARVTRTVPATKAELPSIGGEARDIANGSAFLLDPSDVNALAALAPGVFAGADGNSMMGISALQNSTLIDGMRFDGSILPPDAACGASIASSTSDPSRGRFAGGQTALSSCRGHDVTEAAARIAVTHPGLAWADPNSTLTPARSVTLSGFVAGPVRAANAHYRLSYFAIARDAENTTLLSSPTVASQVGLSTDSVSTLLADLDSLHFSIAGARRAENSTQTSATAFLNADGLVGGSTSWLLTATGSLSRQTLGFGTLTVPAALPAIENASLRTMVQVSSPMLGGLDQLTLVASRRTTSLSSSPQYALGSTIVGTTANDSSGGATTVTFGGGLGAFHSSLDVLDTQNEFRWSARDFAHQLSVGQQLTLSGFGRVESADLAGSFFYRSLTDLGQNRPSEYSRTLDSARASNRQTQASAWIKDIWRVSKRVSVEGGLRVDLARFDGNPGYNPRVDSLFGLRSDVIPTDFGVSPRIGIAWLAVHRPPQMYHDKATGQVSRMVFVDMASFENHPRANLGTGITVFADVGAFRGVIPTDRVATLSARNGASGGVRTLSCIGADAPIPDWSSPSGSVFSNCAGGTGPVASAATQTAVYAFAPSYAPPLAWKANIGLTGIWLGNVGEAALSLVLADVRHTEGTFDANLARAASFQLNSEAGRPVYAPAAAIDPSTGRIAPGTAAISPTYSTVREFVSDLNQQAAQLNAEVKLRSHGFVRFEIQLRYSMNLQRQLIRGFDGTTNGDPRALEAVGGTQPVHQIVISPLPWRIGWLRVAPRLNIQSGTAYTPTVVGDINGDGRSNDRAFVPDPSAITDPTLAGQFAHLLAQTPASARACLERQFNRIAEPASCRGPWQVRLDLNVDLAPQGIGGNDRLHVTTRIFNAGAALLRLAGASSALTQGSLPPDGRLLYVTGFDPASNKFRYQVNESFGQPISFGSASHQFPPLQLQLGIEYKLGATNPNLARWGLSPDKNAPYTREQILSAFGPFTRNPVAEIIALRDTLALTDAQVNDLQTLSANYSEARERALAPFVTAIQSRGRRLTDNDVAGPLTTLVSVLGTAQADARDGALALLSKSQELKLLAYSASRAPR